MTASPAPVTLATYRVVRCPTCGGASRYDDTNPWRPFCSEACRRTDLGAWASERFRIACESLPDAVGDGVDPIASTRDR
jgi:hypothetical protein